MTIRKRATLVEIQANEDAVFDLIYVPGLSDDPCTTWNWGNPSCLEPPSEEPLPRKYENGRVLAYSYQSDAAGCCDSNLSLVKMIRNAAEDLLNEFERLGFRGTKHRASGSILIEESRISTQPRPVVFALILAASNATDLLICRTQGTIFLGTPHGVDAKDWATKQSIMTRFGKMGLQDHTYQALADVSHVFHKMSSFIATTHVCSSEWKECSDADILHEGCLGAIMGDSFMLKPETKQHLLCPGTTSLSAVFERAISHAIDRAISVVPRARTSFPDHLAQQKNLAKSLSLKRMSGTCEWLFKLNDYKKWLSKNGPACLWMYGLPGAGKSVLTSAVLDNLTMLRNVEYSTVYFIGDFDSSGADLAQLVLWNLALQLNEQRLFKNPNYQLQSNRAVVENSGFPMALTTFQSHFSSILDNIKTDNGIIFVLDGLDECIAVAILHEVVEMNAFRGEPDLCKLWISGRTPYPAGVPSEQVIEYCLSAAPGARHDLLQFAKHELSKIPSEACKHGSSFACAPENIYARARENFLCLALFLQDYRRPRVLDSPAIGSTSFGLDDFYKVALQRIPPRNAHFVGRIFTWLVAARRPLKLSELLEAVAIGTDHRDVRADVVVSSEHPESELPSICGFLVTVTGEGTVTFVHRSVREYLLSIEDKDSSAYHIRGAHTIIAQTCLNLLTSSQADEAFLLSSNTTGISTSACVAHSSTLIKYAATNWMFHYRLGEPGSNLLPGMLQHCLYKVLGRAAKKLRIPRDECSNFIQQAALRFCSVHGLKSLAQMYLAMGTPPDGGVCTHCATPVELAVNNNNPDVVTLLLRKGAVLSPKARSSGAKLLYQAVAQGSLDTTKVLLAQEIPLDIVSPDSAMTLLQSAGYLTGYGAYYNAGAHMEGSAVQFEGPSPASC